MYNHYAPSTKETILLCLVFAPAIIPFAAIFFTIHFTALAIHKIRNY
jgi:hypothetical protein